jgi:hypothetical protein
MKNDDRQELIDLLTTACALLEIEANDHDQNHVAERDRRKSIAVTLRSFTLRARNTIKGVSQ